jgi:RNA polymerase sigma-70 factor (ECF subfamily)
MGHFDAVQGSDGPAALALDEALNALEVVDRCKSHVVDAAILRGLSVDETAEALQVSADTVILDWLAKTWLQHELSWEAR